MGSNIIELAKLGHERAAELKASCGAVDVRSLAQLISDLATQLEVQLVIGNAQEVQLANAESKCRELAAENVGIKEAIPQLKNIDYQNENMDDVTWAEEIGFNAAVMAMHGLVPKTPATDSFLAEVRAQGVEMFAASLKVVGGHEHPYSAVANEFATKLRQEAAQ
ncbi:TPA: hypothetical protein G8Z49_004601 [Salmonella enterica]|uniref:Ead/Ea22-like family protein n=1 Tax=Salmonella enterica TaxID=28901 RepID=A0A761M4Q5_SALER|nr:hypothetical protein [Salmonella enterica]